MTAPIGGDWDARSVRGIGPHPSDPGAFTVAQLVCSLIVAARPSVHIEHVGSTAVPGLVGKGVVDLQVSVEPGHVFEITTLLLELGFTRQGGPKPWPATRPMLIGTFRLDQSVYGLHCHVVPTDDPQLQSMPAFRDLLRGRPELAAAYADEKRRIAATTRDVYLYTDDKAAFIDGLMGLTP